VRNILKKILLIMQRLFGINNLYDLLLHSEFSSRRINTKNPLNKFSQLNGFSQCDEDGITLEILKRIGLKEGNFVEFGVGDGTENNTLILLSSGWKGFWFGGEALAFKHEDSKKLSFEKIWITLDNIYNLIEPIDNINVISIDLDGNDFYFVEKLLLENIKPELFIVEYNAKFSPSIDFKIEYNKDHKWNNDDYFGASLKTFNDLFNENDYFLACCSLSGANAFFVKSKYKHLFSDIPKNIHDIYWEPFYFLRSKKMHRTSIHTILKIIN